jgi:hypothetical protein
MSLHEPASRAGDATDEPVNFLTTFTRGRCGSLINGWPVYCQFSALGTGQREEPIIF